MWLFYFHSTLIYKNFKKKSSRANGRDNWRNKIVNNTYFTKVRSTEKPEVIEYWAKSHKYLIGLNFHGFCPVVFDFSFLDSALYASILISIKIIWLYGLKPQAFLLNGTLMIVIKTLPALH